MHHRMAIFAMVETVALVCTRELRVPLVDGHCFRLKPNVNPFRHSLADAGVFSQKATLRLCHRYVDIGWVEDVV